MSGRRKPEAQPSGRAEGASWKLNRVEEWKAQAGSSTERGRAEGASRKLNRRHRRWTRHSAQAERVGQRKARDGSCSRCEIINDESARGFGFWRFRFCSPISLCPFLIDPRLQLSTRLRRLRRRIVESARRFRGAGSIHKRKHRQRLKQMILPKPLAVLR